MSIGQAFLILALFCTAVAGTHKCVWVRGALQCHRDPTKQLNVEVRVYDRDGFSIFKAFDPDDLMGVTFTEPDGTFQLDGCGDDFNWLPGLQNLPDPYIRIHHYCNGEHGETIELPEFNTFVPETYDLGILVLDSKKQPNATVTFPVPSNPRHRVQVQPADDSNEAGDKTKRPSSVGSANSGEEVTIFDVLNSKEQQKAFGGDGDKSTPKHDGEEVVSVTRPDQSNWELPVELSGSEELGTQSEAKKSKERRPNWTKHQQAESAGD